MEGRRRRQLRTRRPRLTAQRLSELAAFNRVPITELLPQPRSEVVPRRAAGLVIDLQQVQRVPAEQREPLARYAARIQTQRGDYNGQLLSLRAEDLRSLSVLYEVTPQDVAERLATWGACSRPGRERWHGSRLHKRTMNRRNCHGCVARPPQKVGRTRPQTRA